MPRRSLIEQLDEAVQAIIARPDATPRVDARVGPLVRVAAELRDLPRQDFKARLKSDLRRRTTMSTATEPITAVGMFASPRLAFKDVAKAIEFYEKAFGAKEGLRFETEFGFGHAEVMIGDSVIMMAEEWPEGGRFSAETLGQSPVSMEIKVPDVDTFVEHAVSAGAKLKIPIKDEFYGYRKGTLVDPFGYSWSVYTVKEEMSVEEMHRRFNAMMQPKETPAGVSEGKKKPAVNPIPPGYRTVTTYLVAQDAEELIDFVKNTFNAQENFRSIGSAGGYHCEVRVGDSMLMIGGGGPKLAWRGDSLPSAFHIYVPDCDATYKRALAAGASSIDAPADQFYGERSATVKDAAGNLWYIATYKGENYKWAGAPDVQPFLHPLRAEPVIAFMKRAFGAEELGRHATPDGVIHHATLKIGSSHLELGEAHGPYQPMPTMFYLYVPDCDAVYQRALAAGATSISEPTDQSDGDRSGGVRDVFGNQWYIATHFKDVAP